MGRWMKWLIFGVWSSVMCVQAQMPHEVLLLVNKNSQDSLYAANAWAAVRMIPQRNVVLLDIPEEAYTKTATVTPEQFTKWIWEPANAAAKARGIEDSILAWVYSVDFPIRVKTDKSDRKQMSVLGMTFVRNEIPKLEWVEKGTFLSKLFGGPNERLKSTLPGISLGLHARGLGAGAKVPPDAAYLQYGLGKRMPLPSMMLGYTGENGTDIDTVIETIRLGKASDLRGRVNGIYFVTGEDVRAKMRSWQFEEVVKEMEPRKVAGVITNAFPAGAENVMGLMMGSPTVDPSQIKSFMPGAVADHVTSWSAEFQKPQTKMTAWIKAGATGSAGTVVEPYSNPAKYPSARFFPFYVSGCTMLESFYQSMACPLQSLLIGEPLAQPYAPRINVKIMGVDTLTRNFTYVAQANSRMQNVQYLYSFLLDGKPVREVDPDASYFMNIENLSDGYHELRAVARVKHLVEFNGSVDKGVMVDRTGRSVTIQKSLRAAGEFKHGLKVEIGGYEMPKKVELVCGEEVLDEVAFDEDAELILDERAIGEGPNRIQVVGIFEDGMRVASAPIGFSISFKKK